MNRQDYRVEEFDQWVALARDEPATFEELRRDLVERFILEAPPERQTHLRRLQWRIEQERMLAKSPLGACIRLSRLMWSRVQDSGGFLDRLGQLVGARPETGTQPAPVTAKVLPFPNLGD
jgi:hypothetical protein